VVSVSVDIFLLHQAGGPVRSVEHVLQASKAAVGDDVVPDSHPESEGKTNSKDLAKPKKRVFSLGHFRIPT
ncbi:hypothetical protein, partial [Nocardia mexicana]|uniref:hypothetical protein n=1 Tax=Nocardia mexicana TaxID=279262 RepID=UPI001B86A097